MIQIIQTQLLLFAIALIAYGVGDAALRGGNREWRSFFERVVFGCAAGLGILAYGVFVLGLSSILYFWTIIILLALGVFIGGRSIIELLKASIAEMPTAVRSLQNPITSITAFGMFLMASFTLISAIAPPNASDWDSLAYHLAIPKLYLSAHRIFQINFSSHSHFPFTMEMLYTIGLAFKSTALARAFHWFTGILCAAVVFILAKRHLNCSGRLTLLVFSGIPLAAWEATVAYIDLGTTLFTLLAACSMLTAAETRERRWMLVSALFAGLAAGTKMTALLTIAVFAAWAGIESLISTKRTKPALASGGLYFSAALLVASPWYLKSLFWTGNPVFPFFYNIFGGRGWNADLAEMYRISQLHFGIGTDWINLLKMPYALAFHPERFYDVSTPFTAIGVTFVAVLLIIFRLRGVQSSAYFKLLTVCFIQAVIWCFLTQQSRYLLPILALFSPAAAYAIIQLSPSKQLSFVLAGAVIVQFIWTLGLQILLGISNIPVVFGLQPKDEYLTRTLDNYAAVRLANEKLPSNANVVLFGDTRGFYLDRKYYWGDPVHNAIIPYKQFESPADLAAFLLRRNDNYALVNERFLGQAPWAPPQAAGLIRGAIEEGFFKPLPGQSGPVQVYKICKSPSEPAH